MPVTWVVPRFGACRFIGPKFLRKGSKLKSYALTTRWLGLALLMVLGVPALEAQTLQLAQVPAGAANEEAPRVSQRQALELVRARFPGNVVSINQVQQGGVLQYRVRMDNEGNIYTVYVNASTGAITREP